MFDEYTFYIGVDKRTQTCISIMMSFGSGDYRPEESVFDCFSIHKFEFCKVTSVPKSVYILQDFQEYIEIALRIFKSVGWRSLAWWGCAISVSHFMRSLPLLDLTHTTTKRIVPDAITVRLHCAKRLISCIHIRNRSRVVCRRCENQFLVHLVPGVMIMQLRK